MYSTVNYLPNRSFIRLQVCTPLESNIELVNVSFPNFTFPRKCNVLKLSSGPCDSQLAKHHEIISKPHNHNIQTHHCRTINSFPYAQLLALDITAVFFMHSNRHSTSCNRCSTWLSSTKQKLRTIHARAAPQYRFGSLSWPPSFSPRRPGELAHLLLQNSRGVRRPVQP